MNKNKIWSKEEVAEVSAKIWDYITAFTLDVRK